MLRNAQDKDIDTSDLPETRGLPTDAVWGKDFRPFPDAVDVKAIRAKMGCRKLSSPSDMVSTCERSRTGRAVGLNRRARYVPTSP